MGHEFIIDGRRCSHQHNRQIVQIPIGEIDPSCRAIRSCWYGCLGKHLRQPRSSQGLRQALDRQAYRRRWWSWNREIPTSNGGRNRPTKGNVCFHPLGDTEHVHSNVYIALILIAESAEKISNITTYLGNRGLINKENEIRLKAAGFKHILRAWQNFSVTEIQWT